MMINICLMLIVLAELPAAYSFWIPVSKVRRQFGELGGPLSPDSVYFEDGIVTLAELKQLLMIGGVSPSEADVNAILMMDQNDLNGDGFLDKYELGFQEDNLHSHPNAT